MLQLNVAKKCMVVHPWLPVRVFSTAGNLVSRSSKNVDKLADNITDCDDN